ncbi:serine/threonine-protein kinase Nek8 [Nasonia vitripennis]|uniref:non-specific serine/threonine protein kinase n=1 Tax=Nasonia vitripennis TaxID=7425 RepID=A0A7M7HHY2_NASVI|nr:serine/threonine-protein kinase Nek8 [Nasonia vitripennis]XP_008215951.1 serine/threonine-protein kinase Nek8 [Nasonia vitripennis]
MQNRNFQFEALLGKGTFGKVYLVKRRKDSKQFVIKEQEQNSSNAWINKMITAEVECMQILRHPNVVSYYGAWQESKNFYILMEYAAHGTLRNLLDNRSSPLLEQDCLYLFAQVVMGVHHIHSKNILHRDLKPDNIMLTGRMGDIVKIGDFGLSRDLRENNLSHAGSYCYIAPEMLKKEPYDLKIDVWSMGVVLYEMLTQELAFSVTTFKEAVDMVCNRKPILFRSSKVSKESRIMVYKMLQQRAKLRPTTRLLLLCPYLAPYVAKVYLNLGRSYSTSSQTFGFSIFNQFLKTPLK